MLHMILTATTDASMSSVHFALRELDDDGRWRTTETTGYSAPLYDVGLFGTEQEALLNEAVNALQTEMRRLGHTAQ